ncbi:hypothetical protein SAMN05660324_0155 [Klenkia brasiliensis]|uniref:DUF4878 domain-containing protein n=1 Tax=Klenkia brasiliensis TaxID=333142 RepID=A0A1G7L7Z7_9ACTN|nr:hypothetical protein SAMN05660324_0155 [Klenkia brasiliensis]
MRRRRSRWLTVGLPVGLAVLLLLGVGAFVLVRAVSGAVAPVGDAASGYAQALVDGRWADAHGSLCAADRAATTPDDLARRYGSPQVTGYQVVGVQVESYNGETSATVQLVLSAPGGLDDQTVLPMVQEDGAWRPCP